MAEAETGKILGRWRADIGTLGRIILLREFDTQQALMEERRRALLCRNPFNGNGIELTARFQTFGIPHDFAGMLAGLDRAIAKVRRRARRLSSKE